MPQVCNKDCLRCPYPDCILDGLDADDYREARERDKELFATPERRKLAAYQRAYYEANKDEIAAKRRAYREANKKKRPTRRQPQSSARNKNRCHCKPD